MRDAAFAFGLVAHVDDEQRLPESDARVEQEGATLVVDVERFGFLVEGLPGFVRTVNQHGHRLLPALALAAFPAMRFAACGRMAGAGFLALAHTLARGEHIRVKLILERAGVRARRGLELFSHAAASVLAIAFAYYSVRLSWQSYVLHDVSTGSAINLVFWR